MRTGRLWSGAGLRKGMSTLRTAMLLAALTAIFVGVGYLIGGPSGR